MKDSKYIWYKLLLVISLFLFSTSCSDDDASVDVTGISVDKKSLTLNVGETVELIATVNPSNATIQRYGWTSKNDKVAKVSTTGVVEAIGRGKTTIVVKTPLDSYAAEVEVTVHGPDLPPTMEIEGIYSGVVKWGGVPAAQNVPLLLKRLSEFKVSIVAEATIAAMGNLKLKVHRDDISIVEDKGVVTLSGKGITDNFGYGDKETQISGVVKEDGTVVLDIKIESISEEIQYVGAIEKLVDFDPIGSYSGIVNMATVTVARDIILTVGKVSDTKVSIHAEATIMGGMKLKIHGDNLLLKKDKGFYVLSGEAITDDFGYGDKKTNVTGQINAKGEVTLDIEIDSITEKVQYIGDKESQVSEQLVNFPILRFQYPCL